MKYSTWCPPPLLSSPISTTGHQLQPTFRQRRDWVFAIILVFLILGVTPVTSTGGFATVCSSWTANNADRTLTATCPTSGGGSAQSAIDLDGCVGNFLGHLYFEKDPKGSLTPSCANINITSGQQNDAAKMSADCKTPNGVSVATSFDLNSILGWDGSALSCSNNIHPTAISFPENWSHVGCFTSTAKGSPSFNAIRVADDKLTPVGCMNHCIQSGYTFAATQFGVNCFCDSAAPLTSATGDPDLCGLPCSGDRTKTCGAWSYMDVFKETTPSPPPPSSPSPAPSITTSTTAQAGITTTQGNTPDTSPSGTTSALAVSPSLTSLSHSSASGSITSQLPSSSSPAGSGLAPLSNSPSPSSSNTSGSGTSSKDASSATPTDPSQLAAKKATDTGAITGGVIGGVGAIAAIFLLIFWLKRRNRAPSTMLAQQGAVQYPAHSPYFPTPSSSSDTPSMRGVLPLYNPNDPSTFPPQPTPTPMPMYNPNDPSTFPPPPSRLFIPDESRRPSA